MAFTDPTTPNLTDFTTYVQDQGATTTYLPVPSDYLDYALNYALSVAIGSEVGFVSGLSGYANPYVMAVYNLGMHQLLKITPDQNGQTWFADQRTAYKLLQFQAGPVVASSDQSTAQTLAEPEFLKNLSMRDLDLIKTPWGRWYLEYAQQYGPAVVGVS